MSDSTHETVNRNRIRRLLETMPTHDLVQAIVTSSSMTTALSLLASLASWHQQSRSFALFVDGQAHSSGSDLFSAACGQTAHDEVDRVFRGRVARRRDRHRGDLVVSVAGKTSVGCIIRRYRRGAPIVGEDLS